MEAWGLPQVACGDRPGDPPLDPATLFQCDRRATAARLASRRGGALRIESTGRRNRPGDGPGFGGFERQGTDLERRKPRWS